MIITVSLNPAMDKTVTADQIILGGLNRLRSIERDAGGKGINVSRVINALGGRSLATGFIGGSVGLEIEEALRSEDIDQDFIRIRQPTRTNLKVIDQNGDLTEFNEPGPRISTDELEKLDAKIQSYAKPGTLFVFTGSLPEGINSDIYTNWILLAHARGAKAFLDADGEAFRSGLAAKPDIIKPNRFELLQYFGEKDDPTYNQLVLYCKQLKDSGIGQVILSMGTEGALFVGDEGQFFASALDVPARSVVGAGDSMVAALAYATDTGLSFRRAAALSLAASAGAVSTHGTKPPTRKIVTELLSQVNLYDI